MISGWLLALMMMFLLTYLRGGAWSAALPVDCVVGTSAVPHTFQLESDWPVVHVNPPSVLFSATVLENRSIRLNCYFTMESSTNVEPSILSSAVVSDRDIVDDTDRLQSAL